MQIGYTNHSLDRLRQRGIAKTDVKEAIKHGRKLTAIDGAMRNQHKIGNKTLEVVYNIKGVGHLEIITAYWL